MKDFEKLTLIFAMSFQCPEIKLTKINERKTEKKAIKWFESIGAAYGSRSIVGNQNKLNWFYSGESLIFEVGPIDFYYWHQIRLFHFANTQSKILEDGIEAYKSGQNRASNPYSDTDFYRRDAWDLGVMLGIHKLTVSEYLSFFGINS